MCGFHNFPDGNFFRRAKPPSAALIARTRLVERSMLGERVPEEAWDAFFKPVCGAIDLQQFERMFKSRQAALAFLVLEPKARISFREASKFQCLTD
jgi:hypothetical protein